MMLTVVLDQQKSFVVLFPYFNPPIFLYIFPMNDNQNSSDNCLQIIIIEFKPNEKYNSLKAAQKQTVLDMLIQPRTGDQFNRRQTDKQLIETINQKNQELSVLHQVNTRLGHQLHLLQQRLGIDSDQILRELQKIGDISVAYHAEIGQFQYFDELLVAYDETILKQKKFIAMLYSQLEDSEKKAETIIRDNEYLMEENKNKCKKILEIYHRGSPEENLVTSYNKLQREMEQERNMIVREENQHLLDVYNKLEHHAIEMEKQLEESKASAQKYFGSFKKQSDELKEAMLSVDNLLKVKEFLQKTVNKLSEDNISLQTIKNDLQSKIGKLQTEVKSIKNQFFAQKKTSREDTERISIEMNTLKSESEGAIKRQRQTFNKLMILQKQLESAKDNLRSFKRQNQKIKSDFEQTLKMCEAYETKIQNMSREKENVRGIVDQHKETLDNVLLERDKGLLKVQQLQKILQNMSNKNRQEVIKMRQNYQKILSQMQQKLRMTAQQKQEGQTMFLQSELNLKNQIQKLKRENSLLHDQNIKFIENIHINTGSEIISKLKEYEAKNDSLIKLLNQKQRLLKDQQNKFEEHVHQLENQVRNLNRLLEKEKNLTTNHLKDITQERSRVNILANEKECLQNQLKKIKKNNEYRNNQFIDEKEYKVEELQKKLKQAVYKEKETRMKAIEMLEKYQQAEQKLKAQYQKRIFELQGQNKKLSNKIAKLKQQ